MADTKKAIEQFRAGSAGSAGTGAGLKQLTADEIRAEIASLETALRQAEAAEAKKARIDDAKRATALLTVMRVAMKEIELLFPGSFGGEKWDAITPQAWPRDTSFKRAADLSDTEMHAAREAGKEALASLK